MEAMQEHIHESVIVGSEDVVAEDFTTVPLTEENDEAFPVFPGISETESFLLVDADQLDFGDPQAQLSSLWVVSSPTRDAEPVKKSNVKIQKPDVLTLSKNSKGKKRGRKSHGERAEVCNVNDGLSCLICLRDFYSLAELNKHMSTHAKEKLHHCPFCPEMFNKEKNLRLHLALHMNVAQCPECFLDFKRQASFKAHLIIHQVEDTVECPTCKEEFQYPFDRFLHERSKHGVLPVPLVPKEQEVSRYGCVKCNETYDTVKALREHLGTHSKVVKDALTKKVIKRRRTNKNDFCCSHCGKKFPKNSLLLRHERVHTGERPFKCDICSKNFTQSSTLKLHMRLHEDYKPFKCDTCNASFAQKVNLIAHVSSVHFNNENESVSCNICQRAFKKVNSLSTHYRKDHPNAKFDPASGLMVEYNDDIVSNSAKTVRTYGADIQLRSELVGVKTEPISTKCKPSETPPMIPEAPRDDCQTSVEAAEIPFGDVSSAHGLNDTENLVTDQQCQFQAIVQRDVLSDNQAVIAAVLIHVESHGPEFIDRPVEGSGGGKVTPQGVEFIASTSANRPILPKSTIDAQNVPSQVVPAEMQAHIHTHMGKSDICNQVEQPPVDVISCLVSQAEDGLDVESVEQPSDLKTEQSEMVKENNSKALSDEITNLINSAPDNSVGELAILDRLIEKNRSRFNEPTQSARCSKRFLVDPVTKRTHETGSVFVNGVRYLICLQCDKRFRKPIDLIRHLRSHNNEKPFKCQYCDQAFIVRSTLVDHEKRHMEPQFECSLCRKKFSTAKGLRVHRLKQNSGCLVCPFCSHRADNRMDLDKHLSEHKATASNILEKPIRIADPDKKGSTYTKTEKTERKYRCTICPSSFVRSDHLTHHLRVHRGERPFGCDVCGKSFSTHSLKVKHMTTHQTRDKVVCNIDGCGAEFRSKTLLKRHQDGHYEKKYLCPYCQEMFRTNTACKKHILTHLGEVIEKGGVFASYSDQDKSAVAYKNISSEERIHSETRETSCVTDFILEDQPQQSGLTFDSSIPDANPESLNTTISTTIHTNQIIFNNERSDMVQNEMPAAIHYEPIDISETSDQCSKLDLKNYEQVDISERSSDEIERSEEVAKEERDSHSGKKKQPTAPKAYPPKKRLCLMNKHSDSVKDNEELIVVGSEDQSAATEQYRTINLDGAESSNNFVCDSEQFVVISESQLMESAGYTEEQDTEYGEVAIVPNSEGGEYLIFVDENDQPVEPQDIFFNQNENQIVVTTENLNLSARHELVNNEIIHEEAPLKDKPVIGIEDDEKDETWSISLAKRPKKALYKCKQCGRKFDHKRYREHKLNPSECVTMCSLCSMRFRSSSAAAKHMEKVHSTKKCLICSAEFNNAGYFAQHVEKHKESGDNIFTCCEQPFRDYEAFSEHFVSVHASQPAPEPTVVTVEIPSINHQDMPTQVQISLPPAKQKKNSCGQCGSSFKKPSDLIRHMNSHDTEKKFLCTVCDKRFRQKCSLTKHMEMHSAPRVECRKCEKMFYSYDSLNEHIQVCKLVPVCLICGSSFSDQAEYDLHVATHPVETVNLEKEGEVADVLRSECEAESSANTQIVNDIDYNLYDDFTEMTIQPGLIHSRQEDMTVVEKLPTSESGRIFRKTIFRKQSVSQFYQCTQCDASFAKKGMLMRHKLIHDGVKPYKCSVCQASFLQKNGLEVHFRTHTGEKPFSCPFCDLRTAQLSNMRSHVSKKHGVDGKSMKASSFKRNLLRNVTD